MDETTSLRELTAFQSAYGRHCTIAAQALTNGASREAVRIAFSGHGENLALGELRRQRVTINRRAESVRDAFRIAGHSAEAAVRVMVQAMAATRVVVESEWGSSEGDRWKPLALPIVNVSADSALRGEGPK